MTYIEIYSNFTLIVPMFIFVVLFLNVLEIHYVIPHNTQRYTIFPPQRYKHLQHKTQKNKNHLKCKCITDKTLSIQHRSTCIDIKKGGHAVVPVLIAEPPRVLDKCP